MTNSLKTETGEEGKHLLVVTLIKMISLDILLLFLQILPRQSNGLDMNREACVNPFKLIWFGSFSAKGIRWLRIW